MRVPLRWLRDYVEIPWTANELACRLTSVGVKVELVQPASQGISNVIVGEIVSLEKHPNADKLLVAQVNIGEPDLLQIVTGATNVKKESRVPVAKIGACLASGKRIEKTKLRGEISVGMMCSATELGIDGRSLSEEQQTGVMILGNDLPIGLDFVKYLGLDDFILHFEIFANRPDLLGIIGIAREVSVLLNTPLNLPNLSTPMLNLESATPYKVVRALLNLAAPKLKLESPELCQFYTGRLIEGVKVKPSSLWMQTRLEHAGIRSINNVVDITNYVMLEFGQPTHAFDYDAVKGGEVVIRNAFPGEKIITIDGEERPLEPWMLVIADAESPIAIAGVMGGKESEITGKTTCVLLESASFNPVIVRRSSLKLGLRSESSRRFEKGLDPHQALPTSNRAAWLFHELASGESFMAQEAFKAGTLTDPRAITFRPEKGSKIIGISLPHENIKNIFEKLELKIEFKKSGNLEDRWDIIIPTFRNDITGESDLIEELARHLGYDKIPETLPMEKVSLGKQSFQVFLENEVRSTLVRIGLQEVITYGVENPNLLAACQPKLNPIKVANPLSEEQEGLRPSLILGLLKVCKHNQHMKNYNLSIFEIGSVFSQENAKKFFEYKSLGILLTGTSLRDNKNSSNERDQVTFFDLKGIIEQLANISGLSLLDFYPYNEFPFISGHSAKINANDISIGEMGLIEEELLDKLDLSGPVYAALINLNNFLDVRKAQRVFKPLPRYPAIVRDIAIVVPLEVPSAYLIRTMKEAGGKILKEVSFFDCYIGPQIPEGEKSLAYSLTYQSEEKTLTDEEVRAAHEKIRETLLCNASEKEWKLSFRE